MRRLLALILCLSVPASAADVDWAPGTPSTPRGAPSIEALPELSVASLPSFVNQVPGTQLTLPAELSTALQAPAVRWTTPAAAAVRPIEPRQAQAPAPAARLPLLRRLAAPFGGWLKPRASASAGKDGAEKDFEARLGAPDEGRADDGAAAPVPAPEPPSAPQPPAPEPGPAGPRLSKPSGPRRMVLVTLDAPRDAAEQDAALARLSALYGYEHDHSFAPVQTLVHLTARGAVPVEKLAALAADPAVRALDFSVSGVDALSRAPYAPPARRESLLRAGYRALHERSESAALLALMPLAFGTLLVFGPLVGAACLPASAGFTRGALVGGFAAVLASLTFLQVLFRKVPLALRLGAAQAFQAAGGVWLAAHGHPALGAWAAGAAALMAAALPRVFSRLKEARGEHPTDKAVTTFELNALVTALGAGLTSLAWIALGNPLAAGALGLSCAVALASLLPGPRPRARKPAAPAPPTDRAALIARYNALQDAAARAARSHGLAVLASFAVIVLTPFGLKLLAAAAAAHVVGVAGAKAILLAALVPPLALMGRLLQLSWRKRRLARELSATANALAREARPRTPLEALQALSAVQEEAAAARLAARWQTALGPALEALRRAGAPQAQPLSRALSASYASPQQAVLQIHAAAAPALAAYRERLWDEASLSPSKAAAADMEAAAAQDALRRLAGAPEDAEAELLLAARRLDAFYDSLPAGFEARRLELTAAALAQAKFAWLGRGRLSAARLLIGLHDGLRHQARGLTPDRAVSQEHAEQARDDARLALEAVIEALHEPEPRAP